MQFGGALQHDGLNGRARTDRRYQPSSAFTACPAVQRPAAAAGEGSRG